ncbi:ABC transporter substrate-binding protein [Sediminispirochaeta smaragdinae]|uniref:Extracellular solute-binding protein family 1 n=1 Tax=Sediminispirochaeta smaragdinae (strain DSM 11293 / JCM 15392 / SEBR 4228) TaxID=573413 RepID=E1R9V2_SEDSS|nr:extracellular solute-binding protein [Sediminispirochaeta smaragdinae]ADK83271.1 extracellular solute-binding protein family 1 [Sediminispirochaeta smaragdinae DSM 11293]
MKKIILCLMFLLCLFPLFATGNKEEQATSGKANVIEISLYHSWSTDTQRGKALNDIIAKFNEEHAGSIKVNVDINPDFPAYQEKIKAMISAGNPPDIFHYNFNPNDLSRQRSGKLMDFAPYMDDTWRSRFNEGDLKALTIDGKLTSIPFEKAGALIYYNKDLFAKDGYTSFPTTWDELFKAFEKLGKDGMKGISLYTADDAWHATNLLSYLAASAGGTEFFNKTDVDLNTPAMIKGATYLAKAFAMTTGDAIGANYSVSVNNFSAGKTAMVIDGPWLIGSLDDDIKGHVAIAPAPTFGDGVVKPGFTVTDAQTPWAASTQTDKAKEEAIVEFMKFVTNAENTRDLTLNGSVFLSPHLDLDGVDLGNVDPLMVQYITINSTAPESIVNIQRNLKLAANAQIPSLMESLALGMITPQEFAQQLAQDNQ